jgi:hypothetical protein
MRRSSKCGQMTDTDPYLSHISERVVKMFQRYAQKVTLDQSFLMFISHYLTQRQVKDPRAVPYSELYKLIKDGICEYLRLRERDDQPRKS